MLDFLFTVEGWIALLTLAFLEIVLGIDNIIFISIVTGKLPSEKQKTTRTTGLLLALVFRILLLLSITWMMHFEKPLFQIFNIEISVHDLILISGGLFLIIKSINEIHHKIEGDNETDSKQRRPANPLLVTLQIILLDMIFSFDSILTAIGLSNQVIIMIIAIIIAMMIMILFSGSVSRFINAHPTLQVLALSFLILIGFMLVVEAFGYHVPKGYIYFAVCFSLIVEMLNMKVRKKAL